MLLFVYGTLLRDKRNHHILKQARAKLVTRVVTVEQHLMRYNSSDGVFGPRLYPSHRRFVLPHNIVKEHVQGELYDITEDAVKQTIDKLEHAPWYYYRGAIKVRPLKSEKVIECQTYYFRW